MRAPYVFLSVHVCRRASGSGGSVLAAMQLEWPRCDSRERSGGERERRVRVYAPVMVPDATTMVVVISTARGKGRRDEDREREGGRKKDRLG